jgi:hypothetical protein
MLYLLPKPVSSKMPSHYATSVMERTLAQETPARRFAQCLFRNQAGQYMAQNICGECFGVNRKITHL